MKTKAVSKSEICIGISKSTAQQEQSDKYWGLSKQDTNFSNKIHDGQTSSFSDMKFWEEPPPDSFATDHQTPFLRDSVRNLPFAKRLEHTFRQGSSLSTVVFLLMTACVGPGVLSLAYAFSASGWVLSLGAMLFCAILANFSLKLSTKVAKVTGKHTYSAIAEHLFKGKKFAMFVRIASIFNNFGEATADLVLINELVCRGLGNLEIENMPTLFTDPNNYFWHVMFGVFLAFPLCLKRSYAELRIIFFCGFVFIVSFIFMIFRVSVASDFSQKFQAAAMYRPFGIFITLPMAFFSFGCRPIALQGYKELAVSSEKKFRRVLSRLAIVLLCLYSIIGCFGYFHFANAEDRLASGNLLLAYSPDDVPINFAILFFAFTLSFSMPLCMKPIKGMLTEIIGFKGPKESEKQHFLLTAITVGCVVICSALVQDLPLIMGFFGASMSAFVSFNLPCTYYIMLVRQKGRKKTCVYYLAILINVAVFIFSMLSLGYLIYNRYIKYF